MDDTREMVRVNSRVALEPRDKTEAWGLAKIAVESGFFAVKTPAEALIILMTGRELGLTAMQSLRGIYVVKGRPMVSADAMVACVQADPRCEYWQPVESTPDRCVIRTKRRGVPEPVTGVFTTDDAKAAGLLSNEMYRKYPRVMLRHRCAAELVREVYSDVILGIYCEGEIDGADPRGMVTVPREEYRVESTREEPTPPADPPATLEAVASEEPVVAEPTSMEVFTARVGALSEIASAPRLWLDWAERFSDRTRPTAYRTITERLGVMGVVDPRKWLKAAVENLRAQQPDNDPTPSGPNGAPRRTSGATGTDASGSAQEGQQSAATQASVTVLPHVPEWATTAGGIRAHLAGLDHVRHLENSARLHGTRLGAAYVELAAERLIALDGPDAHGSHLATSTARGMVAAWAEAGPRPKAEPRRAGGAR